MAGSESMWWACGSSGKTGSIEGSGDGPGSPQTHSGPDVPSWQVAALQVNPAQALRSSSV